MRENYQFTFFDFEFGKKEGERPAPLCVSWKNSGESKIHKLWLEDKPPDATLPPYQTGSDNIFLAYNASAELLNHLFLGWPFPFYILDLYVEFRTLTNGWPRPFGASQLGALRSFGLETMSDAFKEKMRNLALKTTPFSSDERRTLMDYCSQDVDDLERLFKLMVPLINLEQALFRGEYMKSIARMEFQGVSLNHSRFLNLKNNWQEIKSQLVAEVDREYQVYEGLSFKQSRFESYLVNNDYKWPRLENGKLDLKKDTFKSMAKKYPKIEPLRQLRDTLSQMGTLGLEVGSDGYNRTSLFPFSSLTSRNQPSTTKSIFGLAKWVRNLVQPRPQHSLIELDYEQQEFGIAASLSGDENMMAFYEAEDPYIQFAIAAGKAPNGATRQTHPHVRACYKECALGMMYGQGPMGLALKLGVTELEARKLIKDHKRMFPQFWQWITTTTDHAKLSGKIETLFGWQLAVNSSTKHRTLLNFPMQSNGAEILRLAIMLIHNRGITIQAPIHDAVLIESSIKEAKVTEEIAISCMVEAGQAVLDGFTLRVDSKIINYPGHLTPDKGKDLWEIATRALTHIKTSASATGACGNTHPPHLLSSLSPIKNNIGVNYD